MKNSIVANLDNAFKGSASMESYFSPLSDSDRNSVISVVADSIANQNKNLQFKSNSIVASFVNSNCNGYNTSKLVELLSNKLVNEIKLYKHILFPVLKAMRSSMEASAVLMETKSDMKMKPIEFELPEVVNELISSKKVSTGVTYADLVVDFDGYLEFTYDFNTMSDDDLRKLFIGGGDIASEMISLIISKYNNEELKAFGERYLKLFLPSSLESLHGHRNFLSLASNGNEALQNMEELCMVWGFIRSLKTSTFVSNKPTGERETILNKLEEGVLKAISLGYVAYDNFIKTRVLVLSLGHKYSEKSESNGERYVFVLKENLEEFLEKAQIDAWSCIFSTYDGFIAADKRKKFYTIDELLENEKTLVERYNGILSQNEILNHNTFISNCKKIIINSASKIFDDYVEESKNLGDVDDNLYNYTNVRNKDEYIKRVSDLLANTKDNEIDLNSQLLALKVIGECLFDKTNFYQFVLDTSGEGVFGKYVEVNDRNFMTVSGLSLLINMLISEIELV